METTKESVTKKRKRPKSATRYPKRIPTYVVAFAVQESHDDPAKHQQVPNKRSVENSTPSAKSISPTGSMNSAKTFTISPTEQLSRVLAIPSISEVKIDIIDENQCGDIEKNSPQISSYIVDNNRTEDEQPEVIFNASKHIKRCKDNNKFPKKKARKNKRVVKFKSIHFKFKNPKNSFTRRLEKYYDKANMNSPNPEQIQKQIFSNFLSNVVSRSQILKKVLAKENLLDGTDRVSFNDGIGINDYDDVSVTSSPLTEKKSFTSYTSQITLVRKSSSSSRNEDFYSIKPVSSVIEVLSDIAPYKTDVINVAVAVANSATIPNNNQNIDNSKEELLHTEILTSNETFVPTNAEILSGTPNNNPKYIKIDCDELNPIDLNEKDGCNETHTYDKKSIAGVSSEDDNFVIARTSSDFNKTRINSEFTLISNSDNTIRAESLHPNLNIKEDFQQHNITKRTSLLDRVINLGFYPEMAPCTSSGGNFNSNKRFEVNDVIVTDNMMNSFPPIPNSRGDDIPIDLSNTILTKSFEIENRSCPQKNINLPNHVTIKAKLKEGVKTQKKTCSDEVRNIYPTDLSDMWDRMTLVLELAVKKMEDTLAEKIVNDLKTSLKIHQPEYIVPNLEIQSTETESTLVKYERPLKKTLNKEVFVLEDNLKAKSDQCVQCDLVQNQVIDQLMLKLSMEGREPDPTSTVSLKKLKRPQIVKEYFEILKPPVVDSTLIEVGKGDTITVSTATAKLHAEEYPGFNRLKVLLAGPTTFMRENMLVLTSVPTFFIVLLCLYGIIVVIMKP